MRLTDGFTTAIAPRPTRIVGFTTRNARVIDYKFYGHIDHHPIFGDLFAIDHNTIIIV